MVSLPEKNLRNRLSNIHLFVDQNSSDYRTFPRPARCTRGTARLGTILKLAERVGFEPTLEFPLNTLSKRAPSATRPSLRLESVVGNDSLQEAINSAALALDARQAG